MSEGVHIYFVLTMAASSPICPKCSFQSSWRVFRYFPVSSPSPYLCTTCLHVCLVTVFLFVYLSPSRLSDRTCLPPPPLPPALLAISTLIPASHDQVTSAADKKICIVGLTALLTAEETLTGVLAPVSMNRYNTTLIHCNMPCLFCLLFKLFYHILEMLATTYAAIQIPSPVDGA